MTPMTFPSARIGALMIFWIDSTAPVVIFTPSNTVACRAAMKLFSISGRLSRTVRAARAELLDRGMKPTFFRASGTRKCRCRQRSETPIMATSSFFTDRVLAIFSATEAKENCDALASAAPKAVAMRSSSETRPEVVLIYGLTLMDVQSTGVWPSGAQPSFHYFQAFAALQQGVFESFVPAERTAQLASPNASAYTDFAAVYRAPSTLLQANWEGLPRRRGHARNGNPA